MWHMSYVDKILNKGGLMSYRKAQQFVYFKDLKKGDTIKTNHLHPLHHVTAKLLESPKQGRGTKDTILCEVHGSQLGLFDEAGSIYSKQALLRLNADGTSWSRIIHDDV